MPLDCDGPPDHAGHPDGVAAAEPAADARGRASLDRAFSAAYHELRRLAAAVRRGEPAGSLHTTSLVHEAWLKLRRTPDVAATSPLHFKRIAGQAMRRILVDAARERNAQRRGAGHGCGHDHGVGRDKGDLAEQARPPARARGPSTSPPRSAARAASRPTSCSCSTSRSTSCTRCGAAPPTCSRRASSAG